MVFPTNIPAMGMKYWGSYQGLIRMTTSRKYNRQVRVPPAMDTQMATFKESESFPLNFLKIVPMAKISISKMTTPVTHGLG